jgi:hypothetical protein
MSPRADGLNLLREADARLAEIAPRPELEARILARVRGEPAHAAHAARAPITERLARARRPALVLSFALVAALVVLEGSEVDPKPQRSLAAGQEEPDGGEREAPAEREEHAPAEDQACGDRCGPLEKQRDERDGRVGPIRDRSTDRTAPLVRDRPATDTPPRRDDDHENGNAAPRDESAPLLPSAPPSIPRTPDGAPSGIDGPPAGSFMRALRGRDDLASQPARVHRSWSGGGSAPPQASEPDSTPVHATGVKPAPGASVEAAVCRQAGEWKDLAYAECDGQGLQLVDLKLLDDCGDGAYAHAEPLCAEPGEPANEAPGGTLGMCVGEALGDMTTCEPPEHWKMLGTEVCLMNNLTLMELNVANDCEGGASSYAKILCCGDAPPPDPQACFQDEIWAACLPEIDVQEQVKAMCDEKGMIPSGIKIAKECAEGGIEQAFFLCCPP